MVVPWGARASTAAVATFYETLVMMAAGGLVAAAGFAGAARADFFELSLGRFGRFELPVYRVAGLVGLALGLAFLLVVWPPVFVRVASLVTLPIPGVGRDALPRITPRLLAQGVFWSAGGWILLGLSQISVIRAFDPAGADAVAALGLSPVVIASVALATVAGFVVAVLPGGLGVREAVLMAALAPALGADHAVVAAISLRLVWVVAEIAASLVFFPWFRRSSPDPGLPPDKSEQNP